MYQQIATYISYKFFPKCDDLLAAVILPFGEKLARKSLYTIAKITKIRRSITEVCSRISTLQQVVKDWQFSKNERIYGHPTDGKSGRPFGFWCLFQLDDDDDDDDNQDAIKLTQECENSEIRKVEPREVRHLKKVALFPLIVRDPTVLVLSFK